MHKPNKSPTNPAGRLLEILKRARAGSAPTTIAKGFAQIFDIGSDDFGELFRHLSLAEEAADQVSTLLKLSGNESFQRTYLECLPRIKRIFNVRHLDANWQQHIKDTLFDSELRDLQYCSDLLSEHFPEELIEADQLMELLKEVEALYDDVWTCDLDDDLKKIVLENLQTIKNAVNDYKIRGADGLQDALATIIGTAAMVRPIDTTSGSNTFERLSKVVDMLAKLLNLAKSAKPLLKAGAEVYRRLLPPGSA